MPRGNFLIGTFLLLVLAACCPLTSVHPLGEAREAQYDGRLAGAWRIDSSDNKPAFVNIAMADGNRMQVLALEHKGDGRMEWAAFTIFVITRGNNRYINIDLKEVGTEEARNHEGYIVVHYTMPDKDTLVLARLDLEAVVTAIQKGQLAGEIIYEAPEPQGAGKASNKPPVAPGAKVECARITDSEANLSRFFASIDPEQLFVRYLTLKRVQ